jgi:hypothetical protein
MNVGRRQKTQADIALNAHFAPEHAGGFLLEDAAVTVPIDQIRHAEQRREDDDQQSSDVEKQVVHASSAVSPRIINFENATSPPNHEALPAAQQTGTKPERSGLWQWDRARTEAEQPESVARDQQ